MQKKLLSIFIVIILVPAALIISWKIGDRQYYLFSIVIMILAMVPFFISFENRKPSARELVTIAVMTAIAVSARAAFIMIPNFKPMMAIIIITGMALGAEAGFMTGAIGAFVSNLIFGQGPWTPWQMFAYGMSGFIAGILAKRGIITAEKRIPVTIFGGLLVFCIIGPLLDTCTVFLANSMYESGTGILAIYAAGVPVNAMHGAATAITLFLLCKPISEKIDRVKVKYGLMEDSEDNEI